MANGDGWIVGQIVGSGMTLSGSNGGSARVCLTKDDTVPVCLAKYDVPDFSRGKDDNSPGRPMLLPVATEGNQYCAQVDLPAQAGATSITLYPILRRADLATPEPGEKTVVRAVMKLSLASKELFTTSVVTAFKSSVASALAAGGVSGLSPSDVVIDSVCDDAGCLDAGGFRRAIAGGVTVNFHVVAFAGYGVDAAAVTNSITTPDFVSGFEKAMKEQGHTVTAEVVGEPSTETLETYAPPLVFLNPQP